MQKKLGEDGVEDPEEKKELTPEEKELLKKLEKGEIDLSDPKKGTKGPFNKEPQYKVYTEMGFNVDSKQGILVHGDPAEISKQRRVIFHLMKSVGTNLLHGKSLMNVSLPVSIFDTASLLQRSAGDHIYAPIYAEKMYAATDPIDKMKYCVALYVAGLHLNLTIKKPFNPIWGETYQAVIGKNLNVYCEQTSHHPPISHLFLDSDHYSITAKHQFALSAYPNSASFKCTGYRRIMLKDPQHTEYEIEYPWVECRGFMFGTRTVNYKGIINITDKTNKIYAQLRLCAGDKSFAEGIFKKQGIRYDFFKGMITKSPALLKDMSRKAFYSKDMISYIEGNWIDYVMIDGDKYWELDKVQPEPIVPASNPLPSDSRFRPDLQALAAGNETEAQRQKEIMEELQRNDRKLRDQYAKSKK